MTYTIGSFNMRHFSGIGTHDLNIIAEIIRDGSFDIVALQEVKRPEAVTYLLNANRLPNWSGEHAYTGEGKSGEFGLAFLWNTKRIRPVLKDSNNRTRKRNILQYSNSGLQDNFIYDVEKENYIVKKDPAIERFSQYKTKPGFIRMKREPLYGRFTPDGLLGGSFFEIRLINIHLHFGSTNIFDVEQRLNEFDLVTSRIHDYINKHRYGNNMPAYTIILGDYNFCSVTCNDKLKYSTNSVITEQHEDTTLNHDYSGFSSNYDHFSYDAERFKDICEKPARVNSVERFITRDGETSYKQHFSKVSDHVPIKLKLTLNPTISYATNYGSNQYEGINHVFDKKEI
jgi:endonuclease/exonuclease/phosphatase family metal-dependent hydrolase